MVIVFLFVEESNKGVVGFVVGSYFFFFGSDNYVLFFSVYDDFVFGLFYIFLCDDFVFEFVGVDGGLVDDVFKFSIRKIRGMVGNVFYMYIGSYFDFFGVVFEDGNVVLDIGERDDDMMIEMVRMS